ncbi:MAG: TylF/MycF/NovP-related O-methyltransferase [Spirochaetota bacterium]
MADQSRTNTQQQQGRTYPPGYGAIEPVSNYRPWDVDDEFRDVYELVRDHTMVDVYRLWTLWFVAKQVPGGDVLEVGSWRGGSGTVIARALMSRHREAESSSSAPTVFLADTFAGVVKAGTRDTYYKGGEHANTSLDTVQELLVRAGVDAVRLLAGIFPEDRGHEIADRRFALCHIDVDVYQSAKDTFEWAWPRMIPGGVVVFDDYGFYGCEGVTAYVEELAQAGGLTVVPSLSGQAIVTRAVY